MNNNWRTTFSVQENLSNEKLVKDVPLFVNKTDPGDHKCGDCLFRILQNGDKALCTVMEGDVSLKNGTCMFWAYGKEGSTEKDKHEMQMSKKNAGYVEGDFAIQCGTCKFYKDNWCGLWQGNVKKEQCCMAYDNSKLKWSDK